MARKVLLQATLTAAQIQAMAANVINVIIPAPTGPSLFNAGAACANTPANVAGVTPGIINTLDYAAIDVQIDAPGVQTAAAGMVLGVQLIYPGLVTPSGSPNLVLQSWNTAAWAVAASNSGLFQLSPSYGATTGLGASLTLLNGFPVPPAMLVSLFATTVPTTSSQVTVTVYGTVRGVNVTGPF